MRKPEKIPPPKKKSENPKFLKKKKKKKKHRKPAIFWKKKIKKPYVPRNTCFITMFHREIPDFSLVAAALARRSFMQQLNSHTGKSNILVSYWLNDNNLASFSFFPAPFTH